MTILSAVQKWQINVEKIPSEIERFFRKFGDKHNRSCIFKTYMHIAPRPSQK